MKTNLGKGVLKASKAPQKFTPDKQIQVKLPKLADLLKSAEPTTTTVSASALNWKSKPPDEDFANVLESR